MLVISILITFTCKGGKSRAAQHGKKNGHAFFFSFFRQEDAEFFLYIAGKKKFSVGGVCCFVPGLLHVQDFAAFGT